MNDAQRRLRARLGGLTRASRYDGHEVTAKARAVFLDRFVDEVDPDRLLPANERARRAEAARKAYFTRLALRSSRRRKPAA